MHTCVHINIQTRLHVYVSASKHVMTGKMRQLAMRALSFAYVDIHTLMRVYISVQARGS